jgi:PBP1b-binding outer membrane lipoprotein LpoB
MKTLAVLIFVAFLLVGCAGTQVKYEPQTFTPPNKVPLYVPPADPFDKSPAPVAIYLKKDTTGKYVVCPREEADIEAFTSKELDKITLRIHSLKVTNAQLVELINIHVMRENVLIDIIVDKNIAKELYRQLFVDMQNKMSQEDFMHKLQQGGYWAVIVALLIEVGVLAVHGL